MKKILITGLSTIILLLLSSCNNTEPKDLSTQFEGTIWKAPVSEHQTSKPEGENYYVLAFYKDGKYSLSMQDKNGVAIQRNWEGKYEFTGKNFIMHHRGGRSVFTYFPSRYEIYAEYFGVTLVKQ